MSIHVSVARSPNDVHAARRVEQLVFDETFGNTADQLAAEYGPYEKASRFLLAYDGEHDGPVAVARLIVPSPAGLKTLVDVAAAPWEADPATVVAAAGLDLNRTWDVATLAALPHARGGHVSAALYAGLLETMVGAGAEWWTAIVDCHVLRLLRLAGVAVDSLPGLKPAPYLGSAASVPVFGHLADTRLRS